ncbi:hypothetical protein J6K67_04370 [Leuconostoc mesenteroides]|nr:hypothetical protein [Leuconostoc mesenteroides]MBZ1517314.1 hypothetical protein [Leuconostoc mesenteroides]MBZ1540551.1 hypothetical protein [Leuconostoc mesenteroides]
MSIYLPILTKLAIGLVALIIQINVMGKGNLAPTNALDQVQNYGSVAKFSKKSIFV